MTKPTRYAKIARDIAIQRSLILYHLAVDATKAGELDYARRLTAHALELLKRMRLRKPLPLRRMICKNCLLPLIPGVTARIRLREGKLVITCLACGYIRRFPLKSS
jgi:ribonuclease P protein subunit RPR2